MEVEEPGVVLPPVPRVVGVIPVPRAAADTRDLRGGTSVRIPPVAETIRVHQPEAEVFRGLLNCLRAADREWAAVNCLRRGNVRRREAGAPRNCQRQIGHRSSRRVLHSPSLAPAIVRAPIPRLDPAREPWGIFSVSRAARRPARRLATRFRIVLRNCPRTVPRRRIARSSAPRVPRIGQIGTSGRKTGIQAGSSASTTGTVPGTAGRKRTNHGWIIFKTHAT